MLKRIQGVAGAMAAAFLFLTSLSSIALPAAAASTFTVKGKVVDAATGLPLAGVQLTSVGPTHKTETSNSAGDFEFTDLAPGSYSLEMVLTGWDKTVSEEFNVSGGYSLPLVLSMQRTSTTNQIRTLGRTTVTAAASLQRSAVIYQQVSGNTLQKTGTTRTADALMKLGAVDNTSSWTASYGDDVNLSLRGIGDLETVSLIDGHPIALGLGGLNYELSPSFALRAVSVVYGAGGGDLYGVDAIGGVIDMQTLEPTLTPQIVFTQGYGSFSKLTSQLTATGSLEGNRWGYALALGTSGINGSIRNAVFAQPAAAYDPSATDPAVANLQDYTVNSNIANKSQLYKVRYGFGNNAHLTAVAMSSYYWDNKTGNGDGDYLPWDTAMAEGNQHLANYTPAGNTAPFNALNPPDCPAGTFVGTGTGGNAYGYGTDGVTPDGGNTCVTPSQWALINSGWQGAGPAWQAFTDSDYQVRFDEEFGKDTLNIDGFSNLYTHTYDRTSQLPYLLVPPAVPAGAGCNPSCTLTSNPSWYNEAVNNAGVIGTYSIVGENNEFGFGAYYNNSRSRESSVGVPQPSPGAYEDSFFFRDSWHPLSSPITTYVSAYFKHSTLTNTSFVDPRIAFVGTKNNDVYRAAFGYVSTQPTLLDVFGPFGASAPGSLAGNVRCGTLNSIGSGGNPNALPERASDTEFSWGHRFGEGDSSFQLSLYSEPIWNTLYTQTIPALNFPASFFGPSGYGALNPYATIYQSTCGGTLAQANTFLGVDGVLNIGSSQAEGIDLQGRQRITPAFFVDYGYATNSSVPLQVPASVLQGNLTTVPGSQFAGVPLHKANFALDYTFAKIVELRSETYFVSANNTKHLPNYNYTNLIASVSTGSRGVFNVVVSNLFNQNTFAAGLIGDGVPLPLNQYAAPSDYTPLIGAGATEEFGMTPQTIEFIYSYKLR
ncbi:MAG: TonB-dependent receptor [Candidatus Eremiobacteraeota bacterium]|nr:TonB-dependent receptor [Candidatus Eremiobacteraeota bacterium]MBV8366718.1 TonB-dependent receptor [Candidatus Eremiobacteraeota bacterium]